MANKKQRTGSILIVDDEDSLRETFQFFLTREGYDPVMTAATFKDALSLMINNSLDLIICDIVLDGTSGIDLLKQARLQSIDCPFIMITGYPDVDTASEAVRLGAFDYIVKPIDKELLLKSVHLALRQRHLEVQKAKAEEEKERYRVFLDKVFKSVTDAIIIVDADLTICKINSAARHLFANLLPGVGEGTDLKTDVTAEDFSSLRSDLLRVLKTGKDVVEHRFECTTIDNTPKILSICTSPFKENNEDYLGGVIVIRDLTVCADLCQTSRSRFHRFIGSSDVMQTLYTTIENVGRVDTTVLITGESGTGKELTAEALHNESRRKNGPLIKVDCTAIPENLLESELFGHKKGSFTGADKNRQGHILQADGGTLFLDEIGDISAMTQLRLLRFLQEKTFYPVGSDAPVVVDTRVITATNVNLKEKVTQGTFREDLYYRLRVIDVIMPPLRERENDIVLLADHFVKKFAENLTKTVSGFSDNALKALTLYNWPGNVRELEHVIERAVVLCQGVTITTADLPADLLPSGDANEILHDEPVLQVDQKHIVNQLRYIEDPVAGHILETLSKCGGNKAKAARLLGIDRSTLYRKIREYNIDLSLIALE